MSNRVYCFICIVAIVTSAAGCGNTVPGTLNDSADDAAIEDQGPGDVDIAACEEARFMSSPMSLDFGNVAVDGVKAISLQIINAGTCGKLIISDITFVGLSTDEFGFEVAGDAAGLWAQIHEIDLEPGEIALINVTYSPADTVADSGSIVFTHNVAFQDYRSEITINTDEPPEDISCDPDPIDFGDVETGTFKMMDVVITNNSSAPIDIQDIYLDVAGSPDFSIKYVESGDGVEISASLNTDESLFVTVEYNPTEGGSDLSNLIVLGDVDGDQKQWSFEIRGGEIGARIHVDPEQIDFGVMAVDESKTASFTISNVGNVDLILTSIATSPGSNENIMIDDAPADDTPVKLEPENFKEFHVTWTAGEVPPDPSLPIGAIAIVSNDAVASPTMVPVFGQIEVP